MKAEELLRHYERIADSPDAIEKLRRFALDLAVRGKLVGQVAGEPAAPALMTQLSEGKRQLVEAGVLRRPRDLDDGGPIDPPFPLPQSWQWIRLDAVGAVVGGGTPPAADAENFAEPGEGTPWLTPADLGGHSKLHISRGARDLSDRGLRASSATVMPTGTVLFTSRAPIGYVAIASNPLATNQGFKSIVPFVPECSRFVAIVLQAFAPDIDARAPGTTFKEVSGKIVAALPFPLAPLAEQHRIVAKVDELMALCDRLEAARAEREAARDRLAAASLARLNAPDPETFADDARFALDALPALTVRPDQIDGLRRAIRRWAVLGRLVSPEPCDQAPPVPGPTHAEMATRRLDFELPAKWRWASIADVADARLGKMLDKAKNAGRHYQYLRNTNVHWFEIRIEDLKTIALSDHELDEYRLQDGDVLICEGGHGIGRTAVWRGDAADIVFQKALHRVRPGAYLDPDFFAMSCFVYFDAGVMQTCFTGVGIPHFTGKGLAQLIFPLPRRFQDRGATPGSMNRS